ncbi:histone acetyltransferase p300-like [Crassostrea virginica]
MLTTSQQLPVESSATGTIASGTGYPLNNLLTRFNNSPRMGQQNSQLIAANTNRGSQEWHQSVTQDFRNHNASNFVQAIFPTSNPAALEHTRFRYLVAYAREVEGDIFESANSRDEYDSLLAVKIFQIQTELQERSLTRIRLQQLSVSN